MRCVETWVEFRSIWSLCSISLRYSVHLGSFCGSTAPRMWPVRSLYSVVPACPPTFNWVSRVSTDYHLCVASEEDIWVDNNSLPDTTVLKRQLCLWLTSDLFWMFAIQLVSRARKREQFAIENINDCFSNDTNFKRLLINTVDFRTTPILST